MMQRIEEPYDDEELELLRNIQELERMHREHMRPLYTALARSRELKPVRYILDPNEIGDIGAAFATFGATRG